jgi:hypothetical protein
MSISSAPSKPPFQQSNISCSASRNQTSNILKHFQIRTSTPQAGFAPQNPVNTNILKHSQIRKSTHQASLAPQNPTSPPPKSPPNNLKIDSQENFLQHLADPSVKMKSTVQDDRVLKICSLTSMINQM